jgi:hypothetical protein
MTMMSFACCQGQRMETKLIEADIYCQLATSRRTLLRSDDDAQGIRGLYDPESGVRYVCEEWKLLNYVPQAMAGK